eukprot:s2957_g11.t1
MGAELMRTLGKSRRLSKLRGRSFDLKSAYCQLAVKDASLKWVRVAVFCPEDRSTRCFQQFSLPFGVKASVVAFLRCAKMIQWIAHHLEIPVTCYFDDYLCMAPELVAANTEKAFELLLDLLKRKFDRSGDKADSMSDQVSALGVVFDLAQQSPASSWCPIQKRGKQTLRPRLKRLNELGHHALHPPARGAIGEDTRRALELVAERIVKSGPRRVEAATSDVVFLFTDASFDCETRSGGLGAVVSDKCGHVLQWFGCAAPKDFCDSFMAENQEQAIGELEAFAVLVAYRLWGLHLKSKHVVCFLDNEGSRFLILKGYSSNKVLESIVHEIATASLASSSRPFFEPHRGTSRLGLIAHSVPPPYLVGYGST